MAMLGKYKVEVDTAAIANGDSIAAYLTSAAGALITSTTIGAKEHEDVLNPSEFVDGTAYTAATDYLQAVAAVDSNGDYKPLNLNSSGELLVAATIDMTADYAEDSAHVSGDIGLFGLAVRRDTRTSGTSTDGDYASFNVNASGELWVKDADVLAELLDQGTTLDSTLTELLDQGTTLDSILADTTAILADTATIDSNLASVLSEIQALSFAEDAVHNSGDMGIQALAVRKDTSGSNAANGDYTSLLTWSEGSLKVIDHANSAVLSTKVSVANTATALPASALSNRRSILVQNVGASDVFVGSAAVTASGATQGIRVPKGADIVLEAGPAITVYGITASGTVDVVVMEMA